MKYLKLFTDFLKDIEPLSFEERGRLITAMLIYAEDGTELGLIGNERILWGTAKKIIDKESAVLHGKREAGRAGGVAKASNAKQNLAEASTDKQNLAEASLYKEKEKDKEKEILPNGSTKKERFIPPTVEEVRAYCDERENDVDPVAFVEKYTANGWMTGKTKMKDWKASVRYWETTGFNPPKAKTKYRNADLERLEVDLNARP